jgi:hypothetical protein
MKIRLNMALVTTAILRYGYGPYSNGYTDEKTTAFMMQSKKLLQTKKK